MSHKSAESEVLPELELVEPDKHSAEKFKKINKDILGLQAEGDLVLFRHIPEMAHKIKELFDSLILLREDHSDTNRLVRKMYYDQIPSLHTKIDNLNSIITLLCSKVDELLRK